MAGSFYKKLLMGVLVVSSVAQGSNEVSIDGTHSPYSVALSCGTQGFGASIGYHVSECLRLRLRGAYLACNNTDKWGTMDSRIEIHGNNAGMLADFFPFGEHFYISAGINLSESKAEYRAHFRQEAGRQKIILFGGKKYKITEGDNASICGDYSWNKLQPYIGIGYQNYAFNLPWLMYSIDIGVSFMGHGDMRVRAKGGLKSRNPETYLWSPITPGELEKGLRQEGKDFFDIADNLTIYPVIQMNITVLF